jgi:hypothetical protein
MEALAIRQRRPRTRAQKTTGVIVKTMHDARGIAEPLNRYGELLACQIVGLYNAIHGLPASSDHCRARLGRLFHESEGLPGSAKVLIRPAYQWRYGYNHQTIYRSALGTARFLYSRGLYDDLTTRWSNTTRIVPVTADAGQPPSEHDAALSLVMSSIEIDIRRTKGLEFISHLDIVRNASAEARNAPSPLSIPIPEISHTFGSGQARLEGIHLRPDALFGVTYAGQDGPGFEFFALEYDRSSEDVEPTKSLLRASWLRKILAYAAVSAPPTPIYETYFKVPSLTVLCLFSDRTRMANVMALANRLAGSARLVFKAIPTVDPLLANETIPQLFSAHWCSMEGMVNLAATDERR